MKQLFSVLIIGTLFTACHSGADKAAAEQAAKQKTIDSLSTVVAKQRIIDSMNLVKAKNEKTVTHVVEKNTMTNTSAQPANASTAPAKKKGWSHTAKGAVVGAGTGAVTGALINSKNRGQGAVIGTLIGAGVGAGTGLIVDKSVKKKKKKAQQAASQQTNQ
jgi:F0F1-type ATP synthase assembly protein I